LGVYSKIMQDIFSHLRPTIDEMHSVAETEEEVEKRLGASNKEPGSDWRAKAELMDVKSKTHVSLNELFGRIGIIGERAIRLNQFLEGLFDDCSYAPKIKIRYGDEDNKDEDKIEPVVILVPRETSGSLVRFEKQLAENDSFSETVGNDPSAKTAPLLAIARRFSMTSVDDQGGLYSSSFGYTEEEFEKMQRKISEIIDSCREAEKK